MSAVLTEEKATVPKLFNGLLKVTSLPDALRTVFAPCALMNFVMSGFCVIGSIWVIAPPATRLRLPVPISKFPLKFRPETLEIKTFPTRVPEDNIFTAFNLRG